MSAERRILKSKPYAWRELLTQKAYSSMSKLLLCYNYCAVSTSLGNNEYCQTPPTNESRRPEFNDYNELRAVRTVSKSKHLNKNPPSKQPLQAHTSYRSFAITQNFQRSTGIHPHCPTDRPSVSPSSNLASSRQSRLACS